MKKCLVALLFTVFMVGGNAYAVHHEVFISSIIKINTESCAIELEISLDDQNGFVAEDNIQVDGDVIVDFSDIFDSMNADVGNNDTGAKILAASATFESDEGIDADLPFDDSVCESFDSDVEVGFFIDNTTSNIHTVDAFSISGFGNNDTAIVVDGETLVGSSIDLDNDSLTVTNNAGDSVEVGSSSNANCSLNPKASPHKTILSQVVMVALSTAALSMFRTLKKSKA